MMIIFYMFLEIKEKAEKRNVEQRTKNYNNKNKKSKIVIIILLNRSFKHNHVTKSQQLVEKH